MNNDYYYMLRALKLAQRGRFTTTPNPNVGCVIVSDNKIIGEGWHHRTGEPHAEIYALQMAGQKAKGSTVYITLEPCSHYGYMPPCCHALVASDVSRVVVAMQDPNPQVSGKGLTFLQEAGIEVNCGIMRKSAEALNYGFLKRMRTGLPWIQLKLACSLDGKTAMNNGDSYWITSIASRRDVQYLRAQSSAILTSSVTVINDNPSLTVRWNELDEKIRDQLDERNIRQPVRIVIDSQQQITTKHRLINQPGETWLMRQKIDKKKWPHNVKQIVVPLCGEKLDLIAMMMLIGKRQINNILVEAGAHLAGSLIQARLIDELIIYLSPKLFGDKARSLCILPELKYLKDAVQLSFKDIRMIGSDIRLILTP
ncbi:bifunctional diaminohydroxyphosphoribosylaminopyrimidine deaminase/5-amino-6-(5-phosphoribosylamino)uracil reductase RibD [Pantoea sp. Mhis]|uniref:bifunctional diaminohydroxyphosphoribosylaminopyrimidine deaminase/5-amino-6-(5-phosphoribosylamino)uracil reductase RibD n=1 Tax=Pantoea sp. Mhis TaxID=2576759 RepID=UPI001359F0A9|nr:bifunctional diaminohydroxyphosphoribosylaminopyrimidine deaminase/5-amino-6-(5-phosphoribosylamino)uracil reductase RibD [Pantoea sp. Mhis]MXP56233.1 bifunctional diaminohydroxyphosphoribosylaminopyrimidine deaminase/5-amino-6-(5-phosphoribosylamino)uracil reductase RibD [Pantoea sp. Mhis]